jgi:uncharacterized protein YndB with AHSA1/START domain
MTTSFAHVAFRAPCVADQLADDETVVTLSLGDVADATQVSLLQGEFATEARLALHRGGWTDSLEKLRELIEPGA